jgi:hypothetical protein
MNNLLDIITVTKDDPEGVAATILSTRKLRACVGVRQIIVDSSNAAVQIKVQELVSGEGNIEYIWQKPSGISAAFNLGLSLVQSEWVWFLNGKDEVHQGLDPGTILYILKATLADAVICEIELVPSLVRTKHPPMWSMWPPVSSWIPHPGTITRRTLYEKYGKFNESFMIAMDYEFWFRCFSEDVLVDMISIPIAKFDSNGASYTQISMVSREATRVLKMYFFKLFKICLGNTIRNLKVWIGFLKKSRGSHD